MDYLVIGIVFVCGKTALYSSSKMTANRVTVYLKKSQAQSTTLNVKVEVQTSLTNSRAQYFRRFFRMIFSRRFSFNHTCF